MQLGVFTKKYFFDLSWRNNIFRYSKEIHNFCSKNDNLNSLQNTKKKFNIMKKLKMFAFQ